MAEIIAWGLALFLIVSILFSFRRPSLPDLAATWLLAIVVGLMWRLPWVEVWWFIAVLLGVQAATVAYSCLGLRVWGAR